MKYTQDNPRFVLALGAYTEAFADMPADLPVCIYDRQLGLIAVTFHESHAQAICLETVPDGAPFTALCDWFNSSSVGAALSSEGIPATL